MAAPERRTRGDLVAVAAIIAAVLVVALVVWWRSPERATESVPAAGDAPVPAAASGAPGGFAEAWRAADGASARPLAVDGTVIVADDDTMKGLDYNTGSTRWSYARDVPLCATAEAFGDAVVVYRTDNGCSEVTAVDADSGSRGPQRSSAFDDTMRLFTDDDYITAVGTGRIESWRSDLVRTVEYGQVDAPINPDAQPRDDCKMQSAAASKMRIAVIERCPDDDGVRLSVLDPAPEDPAKPEMFGSQVLGIDGMPVQDAQVVATSGERVAVVIPQPAGRSASDSRSGSASLLVYDSTAARQRMVPFPSWAPEAVVGERTGPVITLWTGSETVALDADTLEVRWTLLDTLGPGTLMGSAMLVPTSDGLAVVGAWDGDVLRTIPIDRGPEKPGPIVPGAVGDILLEQRGSELVALTPTPAAPRS